MIVALCVRVFPYCRNWSWQCVEIHQSFDPSSFHLPVFILPPLSRAVLSCCFSFVAPVPTPSAFLPPVDLVSHHEWLSHDTYLWCDCCLKPHWLLCYEGAHASSIVPNGTCCVLLLQPPPPPTPPPLLLLLPVLQLLPPLCPPASPLRPEPSPQSWTLWCWKALKTSVTRPQAAAAMLTALLSTEPRGHWAFRDSLADEKQTVMCWGDKGRLCLCIVSLVHTSPLSLTAILTIIKGQNYCP